MFIVHFELVGIEQIDYTFSDTTRDPIVYSTIDHFAVNAQMIAGLISAGVLHGWDNLSNHKFLLNLT